MAEATETERAVSTPQPHSRDGSLVSDLPGGPVQPPRDGRIPDGDVDLTEARGEPGRPVFSAIAGFFAGMLFVTALPGGFAALLRAVLPYETAERLFPLVTIALVIPIALLAGGRTRRFGLYMVMGMVTTAMVVLGVAYLALYLIFKLHT